MDTVTTPPFDRLQAIADDFAATEQRIADRLAIVAERAAELRRQYRAADKRRGGPGSADARKYALGSVLVMVGLDGVSDTALLGLFAHPAHMARWIKAATSAGAGPMMGDIIGAIFTDPARLAWCEQWGRILQWRRRKALYDEEVARFLTTGPTDPKASWRTRPISVGQRGLVATLCDLLAVPDPKLKTRGEAFEWLRLHNGNPTFWREPSLPPNLEDDHG